MELQQGGDTILKTRNNLEYFVLTLLVAVKLSSMIQTWLYYLTLYRKNTLICKTLHSEVRVGLKPFITSSCEIVL